MVSECVVVDCHYNYEKRRTRDPAGNLLPSLGSNDEADKHRQCAGIFHFPYLIKSQLNLLAEKSGNHQPTQ